VGKLNRTDGVEILETSEPNDGYQRLWVPHRMAYINGEKKPTDPSSEACPFCASAIRGSVADARDLLVVARGEHCFVILNLFPYNSGHLLVLPYRHISGYIDMDDAETAEFTKMTKQAIVALADAFHPQGFNIGMNQGAIAGAGIAAHLHQHIVPRWGGDANFLPIIAHTKALPEILGDTRDKVAAAWPDEKGLR
jgi:ATP adenylyltransferase